MRWRIALAALLLLPTAAVACSTAPVEDSVVEVDCDAFSAASANQGRVDRIATVDKGGFLVLRLCSNPSTGFAWEDAVISAPAMLVERSREFIAPGVTMPGSAGLDQWTFEAAGEGTCTVSLSYSRPWEGGEKGIWLFELEVTVA